MAVLRSKDIRKMDDKEIGEKLKEIRLELSKELGASEIGSTVKSPGRIKELRRAVARILTLRKEKESGKKVKKKKGAAEKKEIKNEKKNDAYAKKGDNDDKKQEG